MSIWDDLIWRDEEMAAADLEASGKLPEYALQPWRVPRGDAWITSASMIRVLPTLGAVPHLSQLFPRKEQLKQMLEDAIANDWTIVGWHLAYDISMLMALGPDIMALCFKVKWLDGMLVWRHLDIEPEYEFQTNKDKKKSYSLKGYTDTSGTFRPGAVQEFIPTFAGTDEDVDFHATDPASLAKLQRYNDSDNVRAFCCTKIAWGRLAPRQRRAVLIQAQCLPLVAQGNLLGLVVDQLTVRHLGAKLDRDAEAYLAQLAPDGMTEEIVRSPTKLGELMFDKWQLPVLKENKSKVEGKPNSRSTDKEVLHELAFVDIRAKKIKQYREALNARGKFCESVQESVRYNEDGRTHPVARLFGTYTDRMTVASKQGRGNAARQIGFALHQMKREKEFREIITVEEGFDMVEFDAAGQEFRWMAIASNDPTMLNLCLPGEDAHSYMGAAIVMIPYRQLMTDFHAGIQTAIDNRYLGKFANLCIFETTPILTNRGACNIEDVRDDDLVWDGEEFVAHAGVRFSGFLPIVEHDGVRGTPDHKVLVDAKWVRLDEAARYQWRIDRAGSHHPCRSALRIAYGLSSRAVKEARVHIRNSAMRLRQRGFCLFGVSAGRAFEPVSSVLTADATPQRRAFSRGGSSGSPTPETCQCDDPALSKPQRSLLSQLRRTWDQVLLCLSAGSGRVCEDGVAAPHISRPRYRSSGQRETLRGGKFAAGSTADQPAKYAPVSLDERGSKLGTRPVSVHGTHHTQDAAMGTDVQSGCNARPGGSDEQEQGLGAHSGSFGRCYDIVNCGPRTRFAANGRVVHNSLQYRTSAKKLRSKARVDYNIPLEMPESYRIHSTYQSEYKGVPVYWEHQIRLVQGLGYVETFGGNRIRVEGDWSGGWGWSMGSTAINARIQGTGADQKHLAMAVISDYLVSIGGRFMFDLHDGLYLAIPTAIRPKAVDVIKQMLDNLPYQQAWGFTPPIPMPWDAKVGKAWGRLKEVQFA